MRLVSLPLLLLIINLASALGQEEPSRSNASPTDEWTEERIDALLEERENGRPLQVVKDEIDFHTRAYNKHIRNGNCGSLIRMYDPNAMMIGYDGTVTKGLETIHATLDVLKGIADMNSTVLAVTPLGKNARFVFHHERFDARDANGNHVASGESFVISKRYENGLRIFLDIYDDDALNLNAHTAQRLKNMATKYGD